MTGPGPMGYLARPETMGTLISTLTQDRLFEHGVPYARAGLIAVYAEERAKPELNRWTHAPPIRPSAWPSASR